MSIVTPSYNQAAFLEATIRSVLLQGYPNLEYLVIDGGSTDGSVGIIKQYEPWLAYWVSEPDRGQSHAVNKGWTRSSGEIVGWVNSDDLLLPGALWHVATAFRAHPTAGVVYGDCDVWVPNRPSPVRVRARQARLETLVASEALFCQPAGFYRRKAIEQVGWLDESLHYVMDRELWLRLFGTGELWCLEDMPLAVSREHGEAKSRRQYGCFASELRDVLGRYTPPVGQEASYRRLRRRALGGLQYAVAYFAFTRDRAYRRGLAAMAQALLIDPTLLTRLPRALLRTLAGATRPRSPSRG